MHISEYQVKNGLLRPMRKRVGNKYLIVFIFNKCNVINLQSILLEVINNQGINRHPASKSHEISYIFINN